jgi:hypothetical protein
MPLSRIALETGTHSPWVSRLLTELGHEAIVAHSRNVWLIGESRRKDDRLDAQALARLARIDPQLLSPIQHRSAQAQVDLTVIRAGYALVHTRTALVCKARGLTKSLGERIRGRNPKGFSLATREALSPQLRVALAPLLSALETITAPDPRVRRPDRQPVRRDLRASAQAAATPYIGLFVRIACCDELHRSPAEPILGEVYLTSRKVPELLPFRECWSQLGRGAAYRVGFAPFPNYLSQSIALWGVLHSPCGKRPSRVRVLSESRPDDNLPGVRWIPDRHSYYGAEV